MDLWAALLIVLSLILVAALLLSRRPGSKSSNSAFARPQALGPGSEKALEQKLLSMTLGNRGAIERGVTAKRRQHPQASRAELLQMVHDDYVHDRSR